MVIPEALGGDSIMSRHTLAGMPQNVSNRCSTCTSLSQSHSNLMAQIMESPQASALVVTSCCSWSASDAPDRENILGMFSALCFDDALSHRITDQNGISFPPLTFFLGISNTDRLTCKEVIESALLAVGWSWQEQLCIGPGRVNLTG